LLPWATAGMLNSASFFCISLLTEIPASSCARVSLHLSRTFMSFSFIIWYLHVFPFRPRRWDLELWRLRFRFQLLLVFLLQSQALPLVGILIVSLCHTYVYPICSLWLLWSRSFSFLLWLDTVVLTT
jgi:hypothetical protein